MPERARVDLMKPSPILMFLTPLFFGSLYLICFGTTIIPVFSRDCFIFLSCLAEILRFYGSAVFSYAPAKKSQRKHSVTLAIVTHALYLLIFIARQFLRLFYPGFDFFQCHHGVLCADDRKPHDARLCHRQWRLHGSRAFCCAADAFRGAVRREGAFSAVRGGGISARCDTR